jgi:hypothetical protein
VAGLVYLVMAETISHYAVALPGETENTPIFSSISPGVVKATVDDNTEIDGPVRLGDFNGWFGGSKQRAFVGRLYALGFCERDFADFSDLVQRMRPTYDADFVSNIYGRTLPEVFKIDTPGSQISMRINFPLIGGQRDPHIRSLISNEILLGLRHCSIGGSLRTGDGISRDVSSGYHFVPLMASENRVNHDCDNSDSLKCAFDEDPYAFYLAAIGFCLYSYGYIGAKVSRGNWLVCLLCFLVGLPMCAYGVFKITKAVGQLSDAILQNFLDRGDELRIIVIHMARPKYTEGTQAPENFKQLATAILQASAKKKKRQTRKSASAAKPKKSDRD